MKAHSAGEPVIRRSLSIERWRQLGLQGDMLPVTITLDGDSMRPLIRRGRDRVTILPATRDLHIGDVVLFRSAQGRYVVHRIWKIDGDRVRTLGDNCMNPDAWIPVESVWGQVVCFERAGRSWRLNTGLSRAWGRIWMATFPLRVLYKRGRKLAGKCYRRIFPRKV